MKNLIVLILLFLITACASNDGQIKEALKRNPKIVFDVIEENPEQFIEVVNRAAQKAQQNNYQKQMSRMKEQEEKDLKNPRKPLLTKERRLIGDDNSKIVIVEYADYQCPACQMAYQSLSQFKDKYKGQIQFYYKHMPLSFHKMAYPAALYHEALLVQDKTKAANFYAFVFKNQEKLTDESFLEKAARTVGADLKRLKKDVKSEKIAETVKSDMQEFEAFGFTGTPVVLINGVALHGAQNLESLERIAKLTGSL